jgi:hypothetical protein
MLWLGKECILVWCQALWKLPSLPLMWIPKSGIHNRLEFLRNSTGSWKSLRDFHSSHRACEWALSYLTVSFRAQPQDVGGTHSKPGSAIKGKNRADDSGCRKAAGVNKSLELHPLADFCLFVAAYRQKNAGGDGNI